MRRKVNMNMRILCFSLWVVVAKAAEYPLIDRSSFPSDFIFGAGSSAAQYEGAANEYGRGPSAWDNMAKTSPEKMPEEFNINVAVDFYHRYKDDVKLMKFEGLNGLKFSISWSRILPYGKLSKGVNKEGLAFYNNLINELLANGIQPHATLLHFDLPQGLEDDYMGLLNSKFLDDFQDYADLCFKEFGDRIKSWSTINELSIYAKCAYYEGSMPPNHHSFAEALIAAHNMLLAHAKVVKLYREKYKPSQKGVIGIPIFSDMVAPQSSTKEDIYFAEVILDFTFGWVLDPLTYGKYPKSMRNALGNHLPKFTREEAEMVKGSYDFIGMNHYKTNYVGAEEMKFSNGIFSHIYETIGKINGETSGRGSNNSKCIRGLHEILVYTKKKYQNPIIYITEKGIADLNVTTIQQGLDDFDRIDILNCQLWNIKNALQDGVNVKGYYVWSFMDNIEWFVGYTQRFGLYYVDFNDDLKRYPKRSAIWFKEIITSGEILKFDH